MGFQWDTQISIGMINLKHIKLHSGVYINSSFWVFYDLSELFFVHGGMIVQTSKNKNSVNRLQNYMVKYAPPLIFG